MVDEGLVDPSLLGTAARHLPLLTQAVAPSAIVITIHRPVTIALLLESSRSVRSTRAVSLGQTNTCSSGENRSLTLRLCSNSLHPSSTALAMRSTVAVLVSTAILISVDMLHTKRYEQAEEVDGSSSSSNNHRRCVSSAQWIDLLAWARLRMALLPMRTARRVLAVDLRTISLVVVLLIAECSSNKLQATTTLRLRTINRRPSPRLKATHTGSYILRSSSLLAVALRPNSSNSSSLISSSLTSSSEAM